MKATPVAIASNDVLKVIDSEYLDDPGAVWSSAALFLRDPSSPISMLVRNQIGEGLKAAIKDGELAPSERNLTGEWAHESLYGGNLRPFTAECLHERMAAAALTVIAERGVRVLSDYLPRKISPIGEYQAVFEPESKLGERPKFAAIARYLQFLADRASPAMKDAT